MSKITDLSKSRYCKGFQCPKILWLDQYKPEEAEDILPEDVLANGNLVGDLARKYFGEYKLVDFTYVKDDMIAQTKQFLDEGAQNIAEASFMTDGLYCAVDILHRNGDGFDIVEVKSSGKIKDIYYEDMAFQYYVLSNCGLDIKHVYNLHVNSKYVRHGELDLKEYFTLEDCTEKCVRKYYEVEKNIKSIRAAIDTETEPEVTVGAHCERPYDCAYFKYCTGGLPYPSVFDLVRININKKYDYFNKGIITYEDIVKSGIKLTDNQKLQVESDYYNRPDEINKAEIKRFLDELSYPIYHLDFETFQQAVPEFEGLRPYQQIPFQYSLHIEQADGSLEHREFLAKEGTDPRRALAESLVKDIPEGACTLAYNMKFEKSVIENLAKLFPDLSDKLMDIHANIHDLMLPFQDHHYYSAAMQGSYSIKYVLPALFPNDPELDYHNLENVHNGSEASNAFAVMHTLPEEEREALRESLLKYCGLDTFAMVKVLSKLREGSC